MLIDGGKKGKDDYATALGQLMNQDRKALTVMAMTTRPIRLATII